MLNIILLIGISILSIKANSESYFIKYNDTVSDAFVIEKYNSVEEYSNRLEELKYSTETLKVLSLGKLNNVRPTSKRSDINSFKAGGEGAGS